jgi:hypothetical protein
MQRVPPARFGLPLQVLMDDMSYRGYPMPRLSGDCSILRTAAAAPETLLLLSSRPSPPGSGWPMLIVTRFW